MAVRRWRATYAALSGGCSEAALLRPRQEAENCVGRFLRPILHQEVLCPGNGAALDLTGYLRYRSVRDIAEALRGRER